MQKTRSCNDNKPDRLGAVRFGKSNVDIVENKIALQWLENEGERLAKLWQGCCKDDWQECHDG